MHCTRCATLLPEAARFCSTCGAPQPLRRVTDRARADLEPSGQWEHCEIRVRDVSGRLRKPISAFYAEAIGPNGRFLAGVSAPFIHSALDAGEPPAVEVLDGLREQLA